jgi:multidrug efflux pump subunit AcrA (membrane-fusion protein)
MKCTANIDESEVSKIRTGQTVRLRIDAYPTETFTGKVIQVRLQPVVVQNVVTYGTVIDVPNFEYKLKPGMTANEYRNQQAHCVVRVPSPRSVRPPPRSSRCSTRSAARPQPRGAGGGGGPVWRAVSRLRRSARAGAPTAAGAPAAGATQPRGGSEIASSSSGGGDATPGTAPQFGANCRATPRPRHARRRR